MPKYQGTVPLNRLYDTLYSVLTTTQPGQSKAHYQDVSSLAADGALKALGTTENAYLILRPGNSKTNGAQTIDLGAADNYTPGASGAAGVWGNGSVNPLIVPYNAMTSEVAAIVQVSYYLDVLADRIVLHTSIDASFPSYVYKNIAYIGMIDRFSVEPNSKAQATAHGNGSGNLLRLLNDFWIDSVQTYNVTTALNGYAPSVWGARHTLSPVLLSRGSEGFRGQLKAFFTLTSASLLDRDELTQGNVTYKVLLTSAGGPFGTTAFAVPM